MNHGLICNELKKTCMESQWIVIIWSCMDMSSHFGNKKSLSIHNANHMDES